MAKRRSKNYDHNWRDFNATCSGAPVKEEEKFYYKHVNMFGKKTLIFWKETGRVSVRQNHCY